MKSFFLLLLTCVLLTFSATAQTAVARIKYEEAEEAFTQGEYATTLTRLDEAEKILGSTNPRILYLRIVATNKLVEANDPSVTSLMRQKLRQNTAFYLTKYESLPDNEDKYREVYKISSSLQKNLAFQQSQDFVNALVDKYKFKKGISFSEFTEYNSEALLSFIGKQEKLDYGIMYTTYKKDSSCELGPVFCTVDSKGISNYMYTCVCKTNEQERAEAMDAIMEEAKKYVEAKYLKIDLSKENLLIINVPGSKATIAYSKQNYFDRDGVGAYKIWIYMY